MTPSATQMLTAEAIENFKEVGVARMALSLDGPDAATHDDFRAIPGTFDRAMFALRYARGIELDTQLQTTVTRLNLRRLSEVADIAKEVRTRMWSLFFLIVTGRALERFVFVSHAVEIFPSGFLPLSGGDVLRESPVEIYQNSDSFRTLRDTTQRGGKCGVCEFQKICGGSRSRAYAFTGDYLAEDPRCVYQPNLADAVIG